MREGETVAAKSGGGDNAGILWQPPRCGVHAVPCGSAMRRAAGRLPRRLPRRLLLALALLLLTLAAALVRRLARGRLPACARRAPARRPSWSSSAAGPRYAIVSTWPPTKCGLATFSAGLRGGLLETGARAVDVVAVHPRGGAREPAYPPEVVLLIRQDVEGDYDAAGAFLVRQARRSPGGGARARALPGGPLTPPLASATPPCSCSTSTASSVGSGASWRCGWCGPPPPARAAAAATAATGAEPGSSRRCTPPSACPARRRSAACSSCWNTARRW